MSKAKILLLDIETLPNLGWTWGLYEQNVLRFVKQACIATYAAKWLDEGRVFAKALPDYTGYKPGSYDDKALVRDLWKLLDEADIVVAHNGDDFDLRVCKARFIFHGLTPPSPFKTVDTKKVAKKVARFNSNKLDDLSSLLFNEKKIKTDFDLWQGCIDGDPTAWRQMVTYNKKDVLLLERLYKALLPWNASHPNIAEGIACPKCGSERLQSRGTARTATRLYRRWQCQDCGGWTRSVTSERGKGARVVNAI